MSASDRALFGSRGTVAFINSWEGSFIGGVQVTGPSRVVGNTSVFDCALLWEERPEARLPGGAVNATGRGPSPWNGAMVTGWEMIGLSCEPTDVKRNTSDMSMESAI